MVCNTWEMLFALPEMCILKLALLHKTENNQSFVNTENSSHLMTVGYPCVTPVNIHSVSPSLWGFVDQVNNKETLDMPEGWVVPVPDVVLPLKHPASLQCS